MLGLNASLDEEHVFIQILVETVFNHDDNPEWAGSAADTIRTYVAREQIFVETRGQAFQENLSFNRNCGPSCIKLQGLLLEAPS